MITGMVYAICMRFNRARRRARPARAAAAGGAVCACYCCTVAATSRGQIDQMVVVEWNAHLFHSDVDRFPLYTRFTDGLPQQRIGESAPDGAGGWSIPNSSDEISNDYAESMRLRGIDRCVVVHQEPYADDHSCVLHCLEKQPRWLATSLFSPRDPAAPAKLQALVTKQPRIVSTRFHAGHDYPPGSNYFDSFADTGVRKLWAKAVELGLVVELHISPESGTEVLAAMRDFPDTKVLIDHLACPDKGNAVDFANVLELASFPNVYMKLSGLEYFADDAPLFESAIPFTRRVIEAFGVDRMVWGGGLPAIVDVHMVGYSEADRAKVKGGNLVNLLPWPTDARL